MPRRKSEEILKAITDSDVERAEERADPETALETKSVELERANVEVASLRQNVAERKKYAHHIFVLICCWLGAVFALLVADGLSSIDHFFLPEGVVLAIIGSTTLNVLGIFYIVTHYLFPTEGRISRSKEKIKVGA